MDNTINGRMPEEIKKGLELCCVAKCSECPYREECDEHLACGGDMLPADVMLNDIAALIQQLENHIGELTEMVQQLERELDAAVEDLEAASEQKPYCGTCIHANTDANEEPCVDCMAGYLANLWQWRGVQEVE